MYFFQTCLILLEENVSEQANTQFKDRNDMTCSDGFIQLSTKQPYLEGMIFSVNIVRTVTCTLQCNFACYMYIACPFV